MPHLPRLKPVWARIAQKSRIWPGVLGNAAAIQAMPIRLSAVGQSILADALAPFAALWIGPLNVVALPQLRQVAELQPQPILYDRLLM